MFSDTVLSPGPIGHVSKKPKAKEEDNILASYLRGMKINEGQLTLPPLSECPDGFDLFYKRRSLRRIHMSMKWKENSLPCLFPKIKKKPWNPPSLM